jgi:putative ATP-binding cassette transporter
LGAFSLVVNQFQAISWFAAVIVRLGTMMEAMDKARNVGGTGIRIEITDDAIKYHHLTLRSPSDGRVLLDDFSIALDHGQRLLIRSEDNTAKIALFRATAGIWDCGEGSIGLPGDHRIIFLPEYPYVPPGTLRELFTRREHATAPSEARITTVAQALQLEHVIERIGGLDIEADWNDLLSVGELKLIAVARACLAGPRFIFLDRLGTALNAAQVQLALRVLTEQGITYLAIGDGVDKAAAFDTVLDVAADGRWEARAYKAG